MDSWQRSVLGTSCGVVHVHPCPSFHAGLGQGLATLSSDQGRAAWSVFLDWLGGGSSNDPRDTHTRLQIYAASVWIGFR
jgi:hypothetical protein